MKSYKCEKCGAELLVNDNTIFTECLYCGNNIAVIPNNYDDMNIKRIIPFSIEKDEAKELFSKITNTEVLSANKIYVPVRFCSYGFDYLINFEYRVEKVGRNGDPKYEYYDTEELLDGDVNKEIIFGNSKINDIYFDSDISNTKCDSIEFDFAHLDNVSIEMSNFDENINIKEKLANKVLLLAIYAIKSKYVITQVYNENYFIKNISLDNYATLVPVYIIKCSDGFTYNVPGIRAMFSTIKKKKKQTVLINTGATSLLLAVLFVAIPNIIKAFFYTELNSFAYFVCAILWLVFTIVAHIIYKNKYLEEDNFANVVYNKYEYKK